MSIESSHQVETSASRAAEYERTDPNARDLSTFAARADALYAATRALVQYGDIDVASPEVLESVCSALGWDIGEVWWRDPAREELVLMSRWHREEFATSRFINQDEPTLKRNVGLFGKVWHSGKAAWSQEIQSSSVFERAESAAEAGLRSALAFPIRLRDEVLGVIAFFTRESRIPDQNLIDMMENMGSQIGLIVERSEAQATMAESERRLRMAIDAGGLGAWEWDIEAGMIAWSATLERIHGIPEGSFGGTLDDYLSDIHPDDLEMVKSEIQTSLETGSYEITYRIICPDGRTRWLNARGQLERDILGRATRMIGVCRDVTEQLEAHDKVARLAAIVESSKDTIIGKTLDGTITSWNRAAEEIFGYTAEEMIGRHISEIVPDDKREELREIFRVLRSGGKIENHETVRRRKDGLLIDVSVTISSIVDEAGNPIAASAIHRDITQSKRQHDFMAMTARASSVLAAASPNTTMMTAAVGRIAVPALADWCSIDLLERDGSISCAAIVHDDPGKVQRILKLRRESLPIRIDSSSPVARVIQSGKTLMELHVTNDVMTELVKHEPSRTAAMELGIDSAVCVPIVARGYTLGAITFAMAHSGRQFDSEAVAFAEELARRVGLALDNVNLVRDLESSIESKDEFLGLMSHELRTPITAIYGGARLMRSRMEELDAETRGQVLNDIEEESERLFRMVENLLALSRVELGQQPPTEPVLAQRIISKVVAAHRDRHAVRHLEVKVPDDLPPVEAQNTYVEQIVRNILSNAEKYTPKEALIQIVAAARDDEVEVSVCDQGVGIQPEEAEMLFERFYRTDEHEKRVRGLGLGLTVCKRLVEAMGGRIQARANEPQGLQMTFTLPVSREEEV